jgi:DNA-damage-inducible protein J
MNNSAININIDRNIKEEATEILNDLGLSMSSAINIFLTQVIRTEGIPFEIKSPKPSRKLQKAIKEANDIISKKKEVKAYHNVDDMFNDILNDKK